MRTAADTIPQVDDTPVPDGPEDVPPRRFRSAAIGVVTLVAVLIVVAMPFVAPGTVGRVTGAIRRAVTRAPIDDNKSLAPVDTGGVVGRGLFTADDRARAFQARAATLRNTTDSPIVLVRVEPMQVTNLQAVAVQVNRPARPGFAGCFFAGPDFDPKASCGLDATFDPEPVSGAVVPRLGDTDASRSQPPGGVGGTRTNEIDIFVRMRLADMRGGGGVRGLTIDYRVGAKGALRRATLPDASVELCVGDTPDLSHCVF